MSANLNSSKARVTDKLFYGIITILVLTLGGLGSVIIHQRIDDIKQHIERRMDAAANYLERILPETVYRLDAKGIRRDIENASSDELRVVEIFGADGERTYVYERGGDKANYDKIVDRELVYDGGAVGRMRAYFSLGELVHSFRMKEFLHLVILISAAGLVFAIGLLILVKRIILRPIEATLAFSENLASGNYNHRIDVSSNDEMGLLQQSLNKMADELQEYVEELKSSFYEAEGAHKQALEANRLKSEFLANMSHEIRTPVNAIVGFADILLENEKDEERRENLKTIKKSAGMLLDNISDILDFSKIEAGKLSLSKSEVLLTDLVNEITPIVKLRLHGKDVEFKPEIESSLLRPILCDRIRIRQVLLNVLINSAKFTNDGAIILTIAPDGNNILFKVKDTGVGIPKEYHAQIFEPFVQANGSLTREYGGVGLGLAIAKRLTEMMGGRIWIESEIGKGTITYFTVAIVSAEGGSASGGK